MPAVAVLGRIGYDLYAEDRNVPLEQVRHFRAGVGGSSANIAVGLARLGVQVYMIGAVAEDSIGRFLLQNLRAENVDVSCVQQVSGHNVSLCLTEVSPPLNFHQVFYRADPADAHVEQRKEQEEVIRKSQIFVTNGTSLCANPSRQTTLHALRTAREAGLTTVFDVDYRASSWESEAEAGSAAIEALKWVDVVLANTDEMRVLAAGRVSRTWTRPGWPLIVSYSAFDWWPGSKGRVAPDGFRRRGKFTFLLFPYRSPARSARETASPRDLLMPIDSGRVRALRERLRGMRGSGCRVC